MYGTIKAMMHGNVKSKIMLAEFVQIVAIKRNLPFKGVIYEKIKHY